MEVVHGTDIQLNRETPVVENRFFNMAAGNRKCIRICVTSAFRIAKLYLLHLKYFTLIITMMLHTVCHNDRV